MAALPAMGFPIRTSPDQCLVSGSPTLFAATHVLLRLLSPRHPSCALCSLVIVSSFSRLITRSPRSNPVGALLTGLSYFPYFSLLLLCSCQRSQLRSPKTLLRVELIGFEPTTSSLQSWRSPN